MADVLNRTTKQFLSSVNTPEYAVEDWVINPDMSSVDGVRQEYLKISGDSVSEMTQEEKNAYDSSVEEHVPLFEVEVSFKGKIQTKTWYGLDNGNGTYANKASSITNIWSESKVTSEVHRSFFKDGSVKSEVTYTLYTNQVDSSTKHLIRKKAV